MLQQSAPFLGAKCLTWERHRGQFHLKPLGDFAVERQRVRQRIVSIVEQLNRQVQKTWTQISPDVLYTGVRHAGRHFLLHHK